MSGRSLRHCISVGALSGIVAWTTYAIVELCFAFVLPWFVQPAHAYVPVHWGFAALLLCLYPAAGVIIGISLAAAMHAAGGRVRFLRNIDPELFLPSATTITVVLALVTNLTLQTRFSMSQLAPLSLSLLLVLALCVSSGSERWFTRLRFLTHPAVVSALLLGVPWLTSKLLAGYQSVAAKAALLLLYVGAVLLLSFAVHRPIRVRTPILRRRLSARTPAALVAVAVVVLGICAFLQRAWVPAAPTPAARRAGDDRPNVILIVLDTVRADHLTPYGYSRNTTPNLQKFSERATLYTRSISSSDITLSSHASMFTCVYASEHGAHYAPPAHPWGRPLDDRFETLADILSREGYLTLGVVANHAFLSREFGMARGFQYYDQRLPTFFLRPGDPFYLKEAVRSFLTRFASPWEFAQFYRNAEEINRQVFSLLDRLQGSVAPSLLFVNYMDAHWPYIAPPPFDLPRPLPREAYTFDGIYDLKRHVMALEQPLSEDLRGALVEAYDSELTYLDAHVGELMERLQQLDLYDDSLIIITSDHGEAFGSRNLIEHGVSVYQNQLNVPLVVKFPHQKEGAVVDRMVSGVDLMPTILDVLGRPVPEYCEGQSLRSVEAAGLRALIGESFPVGAFVEFNPKFDRIERAVYSGDWKLIRETVDHRDLYTMSGDAESDDAELYNLMVDPRERQNVLGQNPDVAQDLTAELQDWLQEVRVAEAPKQRGGKMDPATRERLRALGYLE